MRIEIIKKKNKKSVPVTLATHTKIKMFGEFVCPKKAMHLAPLSEGLRINRDSTSFSQRARNVRYMGQLIRLESSCKYVLAAVRFVHMVTR